MPQLNLRQSATLSRKPRPIISIGLGGIVHDAQYPAYQIAGFEVVGGYDLNTDRATMMKNKFDIPAIYESLSQAIDHAPDNVVYDLAVPVNAIVDILTTLPDHSAVLMQKPMGDNLDEARQILAVVEAAYVSSQSGGTPIPKT